MLSISHDPFVNDAFERFFVPLFTGAPARARSQVKPAPRRAELSRSEGGWSLVADMPGVDPESVSLEVSETEVKLSFELPSEAPEGMRKLAGERPIGRVERHWRVRGAIDVDAVEAKFAAGRLLVSFKARGAEGPRKIAIKAS